MKLWEHFHYEDPYANYVPLREVDLQGFGSNDPIFAAILGHLKPKRVIEVGTWKGASAVHMAKLCDAEILCVDTWLGGIECHASLNGHNPRWLHDQLACRNGYPTMYETFLCNVMYHHLQDRICPFPNTSEIASRVCVKKGITADLIYVDASHDYADVLRDLESWWPIVREGGVLLGDDYGDWPDVTRAVDEFFAHEPIVKRFGKFAVGKGFDIREWEDVQ